MKMDDIELDDINNSKSDIARSTNNDFSTTALSRNSGSKKDKSLDFVDLSDSTETESHMTIEKDDVISRNNYILNRVNSRFFCKIGNTYAFWFNKYDEPRIVIGPHCK
jgi:hypothetical protein